MADTRRFPSPPETYHLIWLSSVRYSTKLVAKLSDGGFLEIGIREVDAEETGEADEVVSLAEQKSREGGSAA
jgi:hypothetical protein